MMKRSSIVLAISNLRKVSHKQPVGKGSRSAFCRDILDFWVFHVVALGDTFREACISSKQFSKSPGMGLLRIGGKLRREDGRPVRALRDFFSLLLFLNEKKRPHFSCSKCKNADGRLSAIVMDGITEILGKLPNFDPRSTGFLSFRGLLFVYSFYLVPKCEDSSKAFARAPDNLPLIAHLT